MNNMFHNQIIWQCHCSKSPDESLEQGRNASR